MLEWILLFVIGFIFLALFYFVEWLGFQLAFLITFKMITNKEDDLE
jgi:hypothetical protein